jgi:uncharacterized protein DUF1841
MPRIETEDYDPHGAQEEKPPSSKAKANDRTRTAQCCHGHPLGGAVQRKKHCCRLCELVCGRPALCCHRTAHARGDDRCGTGTPDQGNDRGPHRGEKTSPGIASTGPTRTAPSDSDETFAFIAGYTSAGAPYGITFEELGGELPYFDDEDAEIEQAVAPEASHLGGRWAELFGASVMNRYDPSQAPDPAEWLDLDEQERLDRVDRYHRSARIDLPNCTLHATIHVAVENQLAADDEPAVRALARLMKEGLSRHDAVHAIGSLVAEQIYDLLKLKDSPDALRARYCAALERLNAAQWRDGSGR